MRITTLPRLWVLPFTLAGCLTSDSGGDARFHEMRMGDPPSPRVEVRIPTLGEDPLIFTGVRARNDTLFLLEAQSRDLWTLAIQHPMQSRPSLLRRTRGSDYALPSAVALLFWEGQLGFLDRDGTFWNLDTPFPTATFPFMALEEETPGLIREAAVVGDSILVATVVRLRPPSAGAMPGMTVDLVSTSVTTTTWGAGPETLASLAEGMTGMARVFTMAAGTDSLWVIDPVGRQSMSPLSDPIRNWLPWSGLASRPLTAADEADLAGLQQQVRQITRQIGANVASNLLPNEQISVMRGYWHGRTLWTVAQSTPGFVLDGYCEGVYRGTWGERASAIHFAPPYFITVTLASTLEEDSWLRVYPLSGLPELCPEGEIP